MDQSQICFHVSVLTSAGDEYRSKIFCPFLWSLLHKVNRIDVVFDTYVADSLKSACREKRGSGLKIQVSETTKLPENWQQF